MSYWDFNGGVRASDADRERAVVCLKRHYAAGRTGMDDFEHRVRRAYAAEWRGELRSIQRDLPFELPIDRRRVMTTVQRGLYKAHFACFATFNTGMLSVWAWSGGHEFWPAVTIVPGAALLAWHRKGLPARHVKREHPLRIDSRVGNA